MGLKRLLFLGLLFTSVYIGFGQNDVHGQVGNGSGLVNSIQNQDLNKALFYSNSDKIYDNLMKVSQIGEHNKLTVLNKGVNVQWLAQIGRNNSFSFYNPKDSSLSTMKLLQIGDSNSLSIQGSNALFTDVTIIQRSNFKSLVIRNF